MSYKVYCKGRFIKQKVLNKRLKAVAAMAEAKKRQKRVLNWVKYMRCCPLVFSVNFSLFINYYLRNCVFLKNLLVIV